MTEKLKVAGYIRVSTPGQAKEGESLATQREAIRKFAEEKRWKLTNVYADEGVSGAKNNRPQLIRLLEAASRKEFEFLVIHRLSRFGRNARDLLNNVQVLKDAGVKLISLKDQIDYSTPYGQAMLTMLAAIAQLERDIIEEQMKENKLARWRDGRTFIGRPPFGYLWNKEAKKLEVNEVEAAIYREIVEMYAGLSMGMKAITLKLNERGLNARRRPFTMTTVSDILKNPAYCGHYVLNRYRYKDGRRMDGKGKEEGSENKAELKPESEHIHFDIPALISKREWDAIQRKTSFNKTKSKRGYGESPYWLRDLLVCGECGGKVRPRHGGKHKDGSSVRYYACYWHMTDGKIRQIARKEKCPLPYVQAERLETEVWNAVMRPYLFHSGSFKGGTWTPSKMGELLDASRYDKTIREKGKAVESLQADLKKLATSRERIFDLMEDERFDKNEMARRLNQNKEETLTVEGKIKDAQQRLMQAREAKQNDGLYRRFMRDKKSVLKRLAGDLFRLGADDKKRLAEGSVSGKVKLERGYDEETDSFIPIPKLEASPNMALLEQLMEEGKIKGLDKDGSHQTASH